MANVFEEMELGRSRVRAALTSAEGLTSQQVGETSALGKALDLPSGVVEADPARARQEMTFRRISEEELFARWAEQRKENAALARDDTDGLSNVFASAKAFGESVANAGNRAMQWLTFESADDVQNMGRQLVHGAADLNRSLLGTAQGLSDNLFGAGSETSKALKSAQDWVKWVRPEEVKGDTFLGQLGYDFVRSIPQQAGNIMAALANPAAALSLMGVQLGGGSYAELREQGVTPQRALVSGLANAVMQAPLEKLSLDRFMGIFNSASFRDTIGRTLGAMGSEFVTEYLQKYPELVTNLWGLAEKQGTDPADQIAWFGRTLLDADTLARANREGLYEGLIGAMWGGLGGGVRSLAIRNIERQKALDFAQRSVELHDAVEGSQTKQVAPDYMEDALDNASDVLAQSVYIPAQAALDLAAQGQDVLTPLGITADQVQQAVETGVDLEVKMSSLQSRLDAAGMAAVSQIMRQNPDAPNAVEASQVDAAAQAQAVVEETRKRQRRADAVLQEEQRLVREMQPLVGKDAAETYGKLHSAQARAFEAAYGVDAAGLMKRRSVGLEDSVSKKIDEDKELRRKKFEENLLGLFDVETEDSGVLTVRVSKGLDGYVDLFIEHDGDLQTITINADHFENLGSVESVVDYYLEPFGILSKRKISLDEYTNKGKQAKSETLDQTAYHGTPHRFDEFSLDAIGTGEGAQAHGWGLYFAKDRKVSEDYRNRLRKGRSRGQLFEVDIPENDVLLDEQKSFGEQPDAVKQALLAVYKSFPKERLALVREEMQARIKNDKELEEKRLGLESEKQHLANRIKALETIGKERPTGSNPFDPKSSARLYDQGVKMLHDLYSEEQVARLESDAEYLAQEKEAISGRMADIAGEIEQNSQEIQAKKEKERDTIGQASLNGLLGMMTGSDLYSGISIMAESQRAASELLNSNGIKGITYDGGQDGRSFVIFDDKAIDVMQTFYQDAPKLMAVRDGEKQIMPAEDAEYFAAIEAGDMDAVRQMVREKAERNGFTDAIPEQTNAYVMRTKAAPKKTIKVYKVFTLAPDGSPTALFVSGTEKLPQGVWLDAVDSWHFTGLNGREYIPSTQNPYTKGGKTGGSQKIPSDEIRQELIARGFLPEGSKANTIVALAYRPGWHAGSLPFFPQGGVRPPKGTTSNYPNIHRYNQVVFECELAADIDYTEIAGNQEKARKKDGTIDAGEADLQYLPENGFYYYATNPLTRANPELGAWVISASLKINRALTQEECDTILAEKGLKPQEWEGGTLDLEKLGYTGQKEETARKTLAPITYDDDGNIIPLSQRFDRENPSVLYQGDSESSRRAKVQIDSKTAAIRIFKGADMSSIPHETAHIFVDDLQRVAQDDGSIARDRLLSDLEQANIDVEPFTGILSGEVDVEGAREMLRDVREELAALDDSDAGLRDAAAAAKGKEGKSMRDDISAARQQNTARRRELLPVERMLSSYVRHLDGLEQARSDMRTLRRFSGVPEEGVLTNDQWRDMQEYAARGFEQYLAEGKAPVKELNGLFARMMRWLKNLYASWRQYVGADLDDDVRRVFDRMLATEEQIRDDAFVSAALEYEQDFLEEANLSAGERKEIEELRSRAEAEVTAKMDRAVARERGKRYRSAFEQAKESLQASPFWTFIREMTRRDKPLTEGEASTGGINRDSLVEYLGEDMTKDIAKKMPKLVNAQGKGDTVDSLAMQYPLTDGDADALANLIYEALVTNDGSVNKLAARHAEQALAEQDREVSPEDGLLAGDAYGQYLEAVEKAMQRLGKGQQEKGEIAAARRMEKERLPERYYRNIARQEVENMTVPQLRPDRYVAALRRALSDRSQAVRRGKFVEAVQAMQRARMAFAMMQEVRKARETAERVQKKAMKAARVKNGTYPAAQTEAIRKLVEGLGLSAPAQAWDADAEKMTLRELVKASVDDTEVIDLMPIFPDWLLDLENPDPVAAQRGIGLDWKQLVSLEIQQVENLLDFLVHSGREQSKADKASLASRVQAVADAAAASMSGLPTYYAGQRDSVRDDLDKGFSSIDSLEWQARKADGFQNVPGRKGSTEGVMERDVYGALRAATDRYHVRLNSTQRAVTPHLVRLLESAKVWEKKYGKKTLNIRDEQGNVVPVPEAIRRGGDTGWTAEMVIGMALNMGNAGNRERLRSSYADEDGNGGLTYDMVSMLLGDDAAATLFEIDDAAMAQITAGRPRRDGILSAADWQAIQGVWDVMGSQWTDTQAAHKRIYGFAPQGIEPGAFTVRVGDDTVQLAGGYYPIKYDPRLDMRMRAQEGKENILDRSEGIFGVPAARKGFTMGRVQHTGRSLRLGVDALQKHLVDSARFIELAYDVRMADKVINSPAFAAEYQRAFGVNDYDRIRPNLKSLVVDEVDPDSRLYRWSELARKHLVYYALSLNLNTALMQLMAVFPAVGDVGTLAVSRGLAQLTTRGMGLVRDVFAASPYMERRFRNIDQDLARKALKFKPGRGMTLIRDGKVYTWEDVANLGMSPIAVADLVITTAIWSGAYHKRMKELRGTAGWKIDRESAYHDQAVAYADKVIAQSNPDNDALSKSAFGRDKGIVRLFNSFSGATTKFAQRTRYSLQGLRRGKVTPWEFGRMEIYDMLLPALGMTVMAALMQGAFGGDDDDNEQLAKLIVANTLGQVAMAVPVFGNPASDMIAAAMGAGSGRRGELSSALDTPLQLASTALTRGGKAYRDGEIDGEKLLMSALDIGSYLARIPVGPVARRTARGLKQWEEGEGTPFSIIKPR